MLDFLRRPAAPPTDLMQIIGEVDGRVAVIVDDMVDTAGTLTQAAQAIKDRGAKRIFACCTHGVLSGPAVERIENSVLERVMVTNTIPLPPQAKNSTKIEQLSVAAILAEAIHRIAVGDSVSSLFV